MSVAMVEWSSRLLLFTLPLPLMKAIFTIALDVSVTATCLVVFNILYRNRARERRPSTGSAFILTNSVYHARLLPAQSVHSFKYTTCSLMMSLRDLELGKLDLMSGFLFGYGSRLLRVSGIAPSDFLTIPRHVNDSDHLDQRLSTVVSRILGPGIANRVDDTWMLATPTYLGVQMNPLTLWFCYDAAGECIVVVLEVHNTFGERHAYALGVNAESADRARGSSRYDHKWTFPKHFHVSPFMERCGFYECSVTIPSSPRGVVPGILPQLPRIKLLVMSSAGSETPAVSLSASQSAIRAEPLSTRALVWTIARMPFTMLLSTVRIFYHAYILHYVKRVDVFRRPEPFGDPEVESMIPPVGNHVQNPSLVCGGLVWQPADWMDLYARRRFEDYIKTKLRGGHIVVELRATNPFEPPILLGPAKHCDGDTERLVIYYRSAKAFPVILGSPTPEHALYVGAEAEKLFATSDNELFCRLLRVAASPGYPRSLYSTLCMSVRRWMLPRRLRQGLPLSHVLDEPSSLYLLLFLIFQYAVQVFEHAAFTLVRARFRAGEEPRINWDGFRPQL